MHSRAVVCLRHMRSIAAVCLLCLVWPCLTVIFCYFLLTMFVCVVLLRHRVGCSVCLCLIRTHGACASEFLFCVRPCHTCLVMCDIIRHTALADCTGAVTLRTLSFFFCTHAAICRHVSSFCSLFLFRVDFWSRLAMRTNELEFWGA